MPMVTVSLRVSLGLSPQRDQLLKAGDVNEFDALAAELKHKLGADDIVIDDIENERPIVLRMKRDV